MEDKDLNKTPQNEENANVPESVNDDSLKTPKEESALEDSNEKEEATSEISPGVDEPLQNETVVSEKNEKSEDDVENEDEKVQAKEESPVAKNEEDKEEEITAEEKKEENAIPSVDLNTLSKEALVERLVLLVEKGDIGAVKAEVDQIKELVTKKHNDEVEAQEKAFVKEEEGDEFKPANDPFYDRMNYLVNQFRNKRVEAAKLGEQEKEKNLQIKYEIIEDIKALVQSPESLNKTFHHFHELQDKWRNTGNVPRAKVKDLYENYHLHVEIFYDYIKINKELRDYDLKKNLEKKIELCEKAEALEAENSEIKAFAELQELHKEWRETGPVPKEQKEEVWERFKAATSVINKKHQKYYDDLRSEQKDNLAKKTELCEKVEEIAARQVKSPKEWNKLADEVLKVQKEWRTIGFAPKKSNNTIYERFRAACDLFFERKRNFYHEYKELQDKNLSRKNELVDKALAMKDREDWREATEDFIAIQKEWKTIGPVPRKYSDAVWKKFREACDSFFDRKNAHFNKVDDKQEENLTAKKALIDKIKTFDLGEDTKANVKQLNAFKKEWSEIGHVPIKEKDNVYNEFRNAINVHFDKLDLEESEREKIKFQSKIDELAQSRNNNKLYAERSKLVVKLKALESDVALWENNLGFFSTSKDSANLVKDFELKIVQAKERIQILADKIKMIDQMDE